MRQLPAQQRVCHPIPLQLGDLRTLYSLGAVFLSAGRLPGHPCHRLECRQFRPRTGELLYGFDLSLYIVHPFPHVSCPAALVKSDAALVYEASQ